MENPNLNETISSGNSNEAENGDSTRNSTSSWDFAETDPTPRQRFNPSSTSRSSDPVVSSLQQPRRNVPIVLDMPNSQPLGTSQQSDLFYMENSGPSDNIATRRTTIIREGQERPRRTSAPPPTGDNNTQSDSDSFSFSGFFSQLLRTNPEVAGVLTTFEKYIPFVLILIVKQLYDHSTGIFVCVALIGTFYHANSVVCREASRNGRRSVWPLLIVMFNLAAVIGLIYFVFEDEKLYLCTVFIPNGKVTSLSELLWIVGVNDFVLKFVSVICKIAVILLPASAILHRKRGNHFLFIELTSQLHRTLVPIPVWLFYLLDHNDRIPAKVLGVILTAAYMVFKGKSILRTALAWKLAASKLMQSTRYGKIPNHEELKATGGICPICHDNLSEPTKLHCKHIFCEECVTMWFDREKTCPMCRAQVSEDPTWRDGSTSHFIQLF